jgi:Uma2 family endonuclease
MATAAPHQRMTLAEFLAWDDGTETRYELVRGQIVAMAPPRGRHSRIVGNLAGQLARHLKPPCGVYVEAGIVPPDRDDTRHHADLAVSRAPLDEDPGHVPEPVFIAEVLSPSTAAHDRWVKLADYRRLPSVREVLLISSRERRVELWRRDPGGRWTVEDLIGEAELRLEVIEVAIPLAAVYENVAVGGTWQDRNWLDSLYHRLPNAGVQDATPRGRCLNAKCDLASRGATLQCRAEVC